MNNDRKDHAVTVEDTGWGEAEVLIRIIWTERAAPRNGRPNSGFSIKCSREIFLDGLQYDALRQHFASELQAST